MAVYEDQSAYLTALCAADPGAVKAFAETLLADGRDVDVLKNRTGLVMVPSTDSVEGTHFHLGEVLIAEAHVRIGSAEGYCAVMGRDLEQAIAIAVIDALVQGRELLEKIEPFLAKCVGARDKADEELLKKVEATRVEMETF